MVNAATAAAAATFLLATGLAGARAADMSLPPLYQPEPEPMVEFGSGWYLRGDLGYASVSAPMGSPPVMVDDAAASSIMDDRTATYGALSATIGAGYQFNRWFRMDATLDWRQNYTYTHNAYGVYCANVSTAAYVDNDNGACNVTDTLTIKTWTGLVNAYGDLGTWSGVTPYIGGGIGVTNIRATANETYVSNDGYSGSVSPTQVRNNFTFALMGGLAYDLAPHLKLDVGYRYLNMGGLTVLNTSNATTRKTLDSQEVRAGLRWTPDL